MVLNYNHVDVFSQSAYGGNSLAVFPDAPGLTAAQMLQITQELRHFESIFLIPTAKTNTLKARVFDLFEELPFAGHPVLGAAAVLHHKSGLANVQTWQFELTNKTVRIVTEQTAHGYSGLLDQGAPEFFDTAIEPELARAFNLERNDLHPNLPLEVVSTGLRYLIVPLKPNTLERAYSRDISELLDKVGAQFAVLLDEQALEVRHWNNDGVVEDVATGSAAGTVGAYLLRHGLVKGGETFRLQQGRFAGRPSILQVQPEGTSQNVTTVKVGGDVAFVGYGALEVVP